MARKDMDEECAGHGSCLGVVECREKYFVFTSAFQSEWVHSCPFFHVFAVDSLDACVGENFGHVLQHEGV